jgi:hypothetical protein
MRAAFLLVLAVALCSCSTVGHRKSTVDAYVESGTARDSLYVSELIPERDFVACIGQCRSRAWCASEDQLEGSIPINPETRARLLKVIEQERERAVHVRIFVQSMLLVDRTIVPNHNADYTASVGFRSNARFVRLRVEFPEEGNAKEAVVDLTKGWFLMFSRDGDFIGLDQFNRPRRSSEQEPNA